MVLNKLLKNLFLYLKNNNQPYIIIKIIFKKVIRN